MHKIPEDLEAMSKRIAAVKDKQNKPLAKKEDDRVSNVFIGLRLGVEIASGTIVGAAMGYMFDEMFDFKFVLLLSLTILGFFAGLLNAYRYMKQLDEDAENKGE